LLVHPKPHSLFLVTANGHQVKYLNHRDSHVIVQQTVITEFLAGYKGKVTPCPSTTTWRVRVMVLTACPMSYVGLQLPRSEISIQERNRSNTSLQRNFRLILMISRAAQTYRVEGKAPCWKWLSSRSGRFAQGESVPGTRWRGEWMDLSPCLGTVTKAEIPGPEAQT
jgi:hypothetical protein